MTLVPALAVFFLSGVAALLYQVVWQRMLAIFSGTDVYSFTIIVAAFMAGLGVGHLCGGHLADRCSRRTNLLLFAASELAIALFSFFSRILYYDVLYQHLGPLAIAPPITAVILFASLLWPTFFMGMSLPLLAKALTEKLERAASTVGALYGVNTLGAAVGALTATWWLLPRFGLDGSLRLGGMLNLICVVVVLPFVWRATPALSEKGAGKKGSGVFSGVESIPSTFGFRTWLAIYGLSGFLALSLEIVWFRLLGVMVKSTAFTFGTLLSVYLIGLALGALFGSGYAAWIRRPAPVFLTLQTAVGLTAAGIFTGFIGLADDVSWVREYFAKYDPLDVPRSVEQLAGIVSGLVGADRAPDVPWTFVVFYFGLPALLILLPTFFMGFSFPVLQRVVQTDLDRLGRRVGLLLVANVAGSVMGTVFTGWVLLNVLGTAGTLKTLTALSLVFVLFAVKRAALSAALVVAMALTLVVMPEAQRLWARLHGTTSDRIVYGEDASGLSVLRVEPSASQPRTTVFVNGLGQSMMPYGEVHTALGMLPAFVHADPRHVVIVGLGSGDTVYGAAGRREIERITCVEIIRPQLGTLRELSAVHPYRGLQGLLSDPRVEHIAGDGRIHLMHSAPKFDIIEADALRPSSAYSGNLYSDEYFRLVRDRLRPKGLAATWAPTQRVHNGFIRVFPYVVSLPGILLGSSDPIEIDRAAITRRLADPRVREHYERAGINVDQLVADYLATPTLYGPDFDRGTLEDVNTDLFPKDEYELGFKF
jgi:predicted membrane-bound spermidine synthase